MGFLRNLAGYIVEGVGAVFGSEKIRNLGRKIRGASDKVSSTVSGYDSYDHETASVNETEALSAALSEFSRVYKEQASQIEDAIIETVEDYFENIRDDLDDAGFETSFIKSEIRTIKKMIRRSITSSLSARLTLTDTECRRILELKKGSYKKTKMNTFCMEVINESIDELEGKLKEVFRNIEEKIMEAVDSKLDEKEEALKTERDRLNSIISQFDSQTFDIEKNEVYPYQNICACLCVSDIIDSAK